MSDLDVKVAELAERYRPLAASILKEVIRIPADYVDRSPEEGGDLSCGLSNHEKPRLEYLKRALVETGGVRRGRIDRTDSVGVAVGVLLGTAVGVLLGAAVGVLLGAAWTSASDSAYWSASRSASWSERLRLRCRLEGRGPLGGEEVEVGGGHTALIVASASLSTRITSAKLGGLARNMGSIFA